MKQILKNESILTRLRQSLGETADVESLRVYEAIALNTQPLRKNHPLYREARVDRTFLLEMAAELGKESRPVQIMHDSDPLPIGRVFHGEVVDRGVESELRVLFCLDPTSNAEATKIEAGSVDQVSVSIMPKQIICSASGFDFLGDESDISNIITGTDPDGNVLGENGVYGKMIGLRDFYELSLVGRGGARNARIVSRDKSYFGSSYEQLAASGRDPNLILLEATMRKNDMDLTQLVEQLTTAKADLTLKGSEITSLNTQLEASATKISELEAKLTDAGDPAVALEAKDKEVSEAVTAKEEAETERNSAVEALQEVAKTLLTASGKPNAEVPTTVAELNSLITETKETLASVLVAGGRAVDVTDAEKPKKVASLGGFRTRK